LPGNGANVGQVFYYNGEFDAYQRTYVLSDIKIIPKILYYHLLFQWDSVNQDKQFGSATNYIRMENFLNYEIPIPPLNEQKRIVEKLEKIIPKAQSCKKRLEKISLILKRFRKSVLSSACSGELTKDWREKNPSLTASPERGCLSWRAVKVQDIAECLDKKRKPVNKDERQKRQGEIPYYGANGLVGYIDDFLFDENLVLVVEDETFIGREKPFSYIIRGKSWVNNHAHVLKPLNNMPVEYLNIILSYYDFVPLTSGTTGRRKLNQGALMNAQLDIATLPEQIEIVKRVEELFAIADKVEIRYKKAKKQVDKVQQSLLAKAFRGELVPQDPNDKPVVLPLTPREKGNSRKNNASSSDSRSRRKKK
jgi:type I restriction enzyme S subunit